MPYANPSVLSNTLLEAVSKLNRNPVKAGTRLALMELNARPYQYLLDMQRKHSSSRTAAAFEKHQADSDAARQVATEIAYGYKIVIAHSVGKKSRFGKNKDIVKAVQRAMLFLSYSLLHSYDEYLPTPANIWNEMWELYEYARHNKFNADPAAAGELGPESRNSVGSLYKQIALTSLVDPYHLREGDVWKVYSQVSGWADQAKLDPMRSVEKPAGYFVIDRRSDQRPVGYANFTTLPRGKCLLLDATKVITDMHAAQKCCEEGVENRQLLARILRSLGLPPKRHGPRESSGRLVNLTSGLTTAHHFLSSPGGTTTSPQPATLGGALEVFNDDGIEIGDTGGQLTLGGPTYVAERWRVLDKAPSGLGVLKHDRPKIAVGVGELIRRTFDPDESLGLDWSIGVVRWLNVTNVGQYHAGTQLLVSTVLGNRHWLCRGSVATNPILC